MNKIIKNIKNFFTSAGFFFLAALLCILSAFIIVFPIWKFATDAPKVYTIVILVLLFVLLCWFIIRKIIRKAKSNEKKSQI